MSSPRCHPNQWPCLQIQGPRYSSILEPGHMIIQLGISSTEEKQTSFTWLCHLPPARFTSACAGYAAIIFLSVSTLCTIELQMGSNKHLCPVPQILAHSLSSVPSYPWWSRLSPRFCLSTQGHYHPQHTTCCSKFKLPDFESHLCQLAIAWPKEKHLNLSEWG